ncbi:MULTISPECIES: restriction endonuclease subunit S [unclassified Chryseobacterium]|uniref:restriction endonuclease subunit S n=1 Tax=unclassified Chryseobacterium TaxID=2593645 RepID=UPI0030102AD5
MLAFPNLLPKLRFPEFEENWKVTKLGDICKMQAGKFVSASEVLKETNNKLYPCYGANGLRGFTYSYNYEGEYSLIGRQGALCGNITRVYDKFYATEHAVVVTPKEEVHSTWLFYLLNYLNLNQYATGMAQPGLSVQNLLEVESIITDSIEEQEKIASLLLLIDSRIQTQKKIIEQLETLIKGVGYKLFNKKIRFKNTDLSEFPSWESKKGNEVFSNISNKNHNSELPILAITQEYGAIPRDLIDFKISVTDKSVESYKIVEKGDFIISLRSFQGGIEYSEYKGICSPAYIILRNKIEVNSYFYKYYFKSEYYIKQLNKKLEGIRDGKMISYTYFSDINLPLPSVNEQTKIANFLSSLQEKIETEKQILEKLELQKKFLLANLFV